VGTSQIKLALRKETVRLLQMLRVVEERVFMATSHLITSLCSNLEAAVKSQLQGKAISTLSLSQVTRMINSIEQANNLLTLPKAIFIRLLKLSNCIRRSITKFLIKKQEIYLIRIMLMKKSLLRVEK